MVRLSKAVNVVPEVVGNVTFVVLYHVAEDIIGVITLGRLRVIALQVASKLVVRSGDGASGLLALLCATARGRTTSKEVEHVLGKVSACTSNVHIMFQPRAELVDAGFHVVQHYFQRIW